MGPADTVEVDQALVDSVTAPRELLGVVHVVPLPVAQFLVRTRPLEVRRLANRQLAHLVNEEALGAREQAEDRRRLQPLSDEELLHVELLGDFGPRLEQNLVALTLAAEHVLDKAHSLQWPHLLEVVLNALHYQVIIHSQTATASSFHRMCIGIG